MKLLMLVLSLWLIVFVLVNSKNQHFLSHEGNSKPVVVDQSKEVSFEDRKVGRSYYFNRNSSIYHVETAYEHQVREQNLLYY
jgi:hypothetical protein